MENNENEEFQKIDSKDYSVTIEGRKVITPQFVWFAVRSFRLNDNNILQRKCATCKSWFNISQFLNGEWVTIYNPQEYRQNKSGKFGSYCCLCEQQRNDSKSKETYAKKNIGAQATKSINIDRSTRKKDTLLFDRDIHQYLLLRSVLQNITKNDLINMILREEIERTPITASIKE